MKENSIGCWLDDDSGSLWKIISASCQWLTIQSLTTGEQQTIIPEEFWLLLDSL